MKQGVVFHRQSGTDTGFHGTELSFDDGRLAFRACPVLARQRHGRPHASRDFGEGHCNRQLGTRRSHLRRLRQGRRAADLRRTAGPAETEVVRDSLTKDLAKRRSRQDHGGGGRPGLTFGERFRSHGPQGWAARRAARLSPGLDARWRSPTLCRRQGPRRRDGPQGRIRSYGPITSRPSIRRTAQSARRTWQARKAAVRRPDRRVRDHDDGGNAAAAAGVHPRTRRVRRPESAACRPRHPGGPAALPRANRATASGWPAG